MPSIASSAAFFQRSGFFAFFAKNPAFWISEGYFRFKADYSISSKDFYEIYKLWCEDNACHSVSAIRFSAELRQNDRRYNLEATNNIYLPGGRRVRGFVGIEPLVHPCP